MYSCQIPCVSTTFLPFLFSGALRRKGEADCTDSSSQLVSVSLQFLLGKQELSTYGEGGSDKIDWNKKEEAKGWKEEEEEDPIPRFPKEEKSKVCSYLLGKKKKRGGEDLMGAEGGKGFLFLPLEGENILFDIRVALGAFFFLSC